MDKVDGSIRRREPSGEPKGDAERTFHRSLALVFLLALVVRMLFVWIQGSFHIFDIYFVASDSRLYEALAHSLLSGAGYARAGQPTALVTPAYPLFLAALHWLGIESPLGVGFVQSIIGAATCVLIAMLGRHLGGDQVAVVAGILSACYVHLIFWTGYVLTDTLFVFFLVASLVALLRWQDNLDSHLRAGFAGVLLGIGTLTRPHLAGFAILAGLWTIVIAGRRRRAAVHSGLFLLLGLTMVLAPWTLRNYRVLGVPIVGSTLGGEVLYQGNSIGATGGTGGYLDARDFRPLELPSGLTEIEVDRAYSHAAWQFMLDNPEDLPELALRKFVNMWRPTYEGSSVCNLWIFGGSYLFVVAFSLLGIARRWKNGLGQSEGLLLLCVAFLLILHLIIPGMIRYRLPAEPLLIVFAAAALQPLGELTGWTLTRHKT